MKRICLLCLAAMLLLTSCASLSLPAAYSTSLPGMNFNINSELNDAAFVTPFTEELCVGEENVTNEKVAEDPEVDGAGLYSVAGKEVLYSKNAYAPLNPASLTKVMTALVALKDADRTQMLTATESIKVTESGAQTAKVSVGDTMSLDQALHIMLIYSANDVANLIAEGVSGSIEAFVDRMNEEAKALGATGTHFTNPNGLTDPNHVTTAYDLYLIFNEAVKYDLFNEIIAMPSYSTVYRNAQGREKEFSCNSTNGYILGNYQVPPGITVVGGKTGTTSAAGHCLILYAKDTSGNPYISVILSAESTDALYADMTNLLEAIY
ncbi:MAG: D-alanyl-D-alanine carboxypeptidase [Lachnospiraceae bacterium]|nr:D-alanyl-D-alanine carboxypeptidase [Lachnospiraceae bacterium]